MNVNVANLLPRVALAIGVWAVFALTDENYRRVDNFFPVFEGFALIGLVALGLSVTMLAGELDLSVGSVAAVAGIIAVKQSGLGLVPCVALAVLCTAAFGAAQGYAIARLGINSLVFTIGTLIAISGLAYVMSDEQSVLIDLNDLGLSDTITNRLWIFSPFSLTTIAAFVLVGAFLSVTRWGREIYAIGGGRNEARAAGVSTVRPIVIAFTLSAGLAGLGGALASLKSGAAQPGGYDSVLLAGVTAALVGGVSLYGGRGDVLGVAVGVLTLQFLLSGLSSRGAEFYVGSLATGGLLLVVLLVELIVDRRQVLRYMRRPAFSAGEP
jgi:ribose transport system permease protein